MQVHKNTWSATFELLLATAFWGFGFISARWALGTFDAVEVTFLRFAIAGAVGLPFVFRNKLSGYFKEYSRLAMIPSLLLLGTLIFQTWGLNYTTASKSGFITTLYVVFVPIIEVIVGRKRFPPLLWIAIGAALFGTALIVNLGMSQLNQGDILTLICTVFAAVQIYWLGQLSPTIKQPFIFNFYQSYWAVLFCLPMLRYGEFSSRLMSAPDWPWETWVGLASLSLGSTVIAFSLQIRAQSRLSPTVSSLIFLLESPFALIFAQIFLAEVLAPLEIVGAVFIVGAALVATKVESKI